MRHLILAAIILLALSGCSPWQYMTVNSTQLTRNRLNQMVFENDTLRLTYDIAGKNGQVTLRIFNKTTQPITVNWRKSAFIRNQQSINFYNKDIVVHGHTVSYSRYYRNFIAALTLPDSVYFIPPGSEIGNDLPTVASTGPLQVYFPDSLPRKKLAPTDGFHVEYRQLHYDESTTPIRFTAYLTFSIGHDNKEFSLTNRFYVSDVYLADGNPESFSLYQGHGDQIYIRQQVNSPEAVAGGQPTVSSNIR